MVHLLWGQSLPVDQIHHLSQKRTMLLIEGTLFLLSFSNLTNVLTDLTNVLTDEGTEEVELSSGEDRRTLLRVLVTTCCLLERVSVSKGEEVLSRSRL